MNRQEKETVVSQLKDDVARSNGLLLFNCRGMTVSQLQKLRKKVREQNGHVKVAKVRLVKRALEGLPGVEGLNSLLREQVALIFAYQETPALAKTIYEFSKENATVKLVGGYMDAATLSCDDVVAIATLPSREVLLAQLCCVLESPMQSLIRMLNANQQQLLLVLGKMEENKKTA